MGTQNQDSFLSEIELTNKSFLILHNDEVNTFDYVIDSLMEVCEHDEYQAEQCALITHHKGKCDIKKGEDSILESMKNILLEKGLSVSLDK